MTPAPGSASPTEPPDPGQHLGLLRTVVGRYRRPWETQEELLGAGYLGLRHACEHYRPEQGEFSTYAWSCIRFAIIEARTREWEKGSVRLPDRRRVSMCLLSTVVRRDPDLLDEIEGDGPPEVADAEDFEALVRCLPEDRRRLLRLRYVDGLALAEAAERLGVSRQRVYQMEQGALTRLFAQWSRTYEA